MGTRGIFKKKLAIPEALAGSRTAAMCVLAATLAGAPAVYGQQSPQRQMEKTDKDKNLNAAMVAAGRERVLREFPQERVWEELSREYTRLLKRSGPALAKTQVDIKPQTQPLPIRNLDNLRARNLQETGGSK